MPYWVDDPALAPSIRDGRLRGVAPPAAKPAATARGAAVERLGRRLTPGGGAPAAARPGLRGPLRGLLGRAPRARRLLPWRRRRPPWRAREAVRAPEDRTKAALRQRAHVRALASRCRPPGGLWRGRGRAGVVCRADVPLARRAHRSARARRVGRP